MCLKTNAENSALPSQI